MPAVKIHLLGQIIVLQFKFQTEYRQLQYIQQPQLFSDSQQCCMNVWYVHVTNLYMKINFTQKENVYKQNHWYIYILEMWPVVCHGALHTAQQLVLPQQPNTGPPTEHWATYSTLVVQVEFSVSRVKGQLVQVGSPFTLEWRTQHLKRKSH